MGLIENLDPPGRGRKVTFYQDCGGNGHADVEGADYFQLAKGTHIDLENVLEAAIKRGTVTSPGTWVLATVEDDGEIALARFEVAKMDSPLKIVS